MSHCEKHSRTPGNGTIIGSRGLGFEVDIIGGELRIYPLHEGTRAMGMAPSRAEAVALVRAIVDGLDLHFLDEEAGA